MPAVYSVIVCMPSSVLLDFFSVNYQSSKKVHTSDNSMLHLACLYCMCHVYALTDPGGVILGPPGT